MLSYRHAFHAGNHADVLKHLILVRIMAHLSKKEAPFCCIDTHAGAGGYSLNKAYAQKNKEYETGISKLWQRKDIPACAEDYIYLVKAFNNNQPQLNFYPGSPLFIQKFLRVKDRLFLYELHNTEINLLKSAIHADRHILIEHADGLQSAIKMLPPSERRGLVLIDPAYEVKSDYTEVIKSLKTMYQRFSTGTYALWYPVVERERIQSLEKSIKNSGIKNCQLFELGIVPDHSRPGMTASGMIVINPPWTLLTEMRTALPWLTAQLGNPGAGFFRIEQLTPE
jgi:23S rRNA (adenine2030-N6)-methyltransferase